MSKLKIQKRTGDAPGALPITDNRPPFTPARRERTPGMRNELPTPFDKAPLSLRFSQSQELQFYEGPLVKIVAGLCPPTLGDGFLIGFGTTGARNLTVEWDPRAVLPLLDEFREGAR